VSPAIAAALIGVPGLVGTPFFFAGGLKVVYDLLIWRGFRQLRGRESATPAASRSRLKEM
jgi:hypothetical protein